MNTNNAIKVRSWNKLILCQQSFYTKNMQFLLNNIDAAIQNPIKVLKDDPASTVVVVNVDDQPVVIKRANIKNTPQAIRWLFARSRAEKNWTNAHKLLQLGIPTFNPIALVEERKGPLKARSYFICNYIEGIDALHYFACGASPQQEWPMVANKIATLIDTLSAHWISHRDLNLSNIILVNHEPLLIDLDSMREHRTRFTASRGAHRERDRFMQNWQDAPDLSAEVSALFHRVFGQKI